MEFTINQILLMQDTIMVVHRRHTGIILTISKIVSREIDPVLFIEFYSSAHNGTISLERTNGKLSRVLRS